MLWYSLHETAVPCAWHTLCLSVGRNAHHSHSGTATLLALHSMGISREVVFVFVCVVSPTRQSTVLYCCCFATERQRLARVPRFFCAYHTIYEAHLQKKKKGELYFVDFRFLVYAPVFVCALPKPVAEYTYTCVYVLCAEEMVLYHAPIYEVSGQQVSHVDACTKY